MTEANAFDLAETLPEWKNRFILIKTIFRRACLLSTPFSRKKCFHNERPLCSKVRLYQSSPFNISEHIKLLTHKQRATVGDECHGYKRRRDGDDPDLHEGMLAQYQAQEA